MRIPVENLCKYCGKDHKTAIMCDESKAEYDRVVKEMFAEDRIWRAKNGKPFKTRLERKK